MRFYIYLSIFIFNIIFLSSETICTEYDIVNRITFILIENYDKKPVENNIERLIHLFGKKSYIKLLSLWRENYKDIENCQYEFDNHLNYVIKVINDNLGKETKDNFIFLVKKLVICSLKNFNMYYTALLEYGLPENINQISCEYIDKSLQNLKYYKIQSELYNEENIYMDEIYKIINDVRIRDKLFIYNFFYKLVMKYRKKTTERLLKNFLAKGNF